MVHLFKATWTDNGEKKRTIGIYRTFWTKCWKKNKSCNRLYIWTKNKTINLLKKNYIVGLG